MDIREEIKSIERYMDTVMNGIFHSDELSNMTWDFKRGIEHAQRVLFEIQHHCIKWRKAAGDDCEALRQILVHFWDDGYPEYEDRSPAAKKKRDNFDKLDGICSLLQKKEDEYEALLKKIEERLERLEELKEEPEKAEKALFEGDLSDAMREAEAVLKRLKMKV